MLHRNFTLNFKKKIASGGLQPDLSDCQACCSDCRLPSLSHPVLLDPSGCRRTPGTPADGADGGPGEEGSAAPITLKRLPGNLSQPHETDPVLQ